MRSRFESEELDQPTLDYLRTAAAAQGRGMPGIFLDARQANLWSEKAPLLALISGLLILLVTLLICRGSTGNPLGIALFLTAGVFLGGWLVVAWLRCRLARGRADYVGHFKYVDPLYLWQGVGRGVEVIPLSLLVGAEARHTYNEQNDYQSSRVHVELADGDVSLDVRSLPRADEIADFLNALLDFRGGSPAERGYAALRHVRGDRHVQGHGPPDRATDAIPEPHRVRHSLVWLRYPVLLASGVGVFLACWYFAGVLRDDAIYEAVKGKRPPHLRLYLVDGRNVRNRDAVLQELAQAHAAAAQQLRTRGDPRLAEGLAAILTEMGKLSRPVVTVGIRRNDKGPEVVEGRLSAAVVETMNRDVLRLVAVRLNRHLGEDLVDVAGVSEGPAMIEFAAKVKEAEKECRVEWTVTVAANPEQADREKPLVTLTSTSNNPRTDSLGRVRGAYLGLPAEFNKLLDGQR